MNSQSRLNPDFYENLVPHLSEARLKAYGKDGADEFTIISRYYLNMALSEALYPVLQTAEVALRNAIHGQLSLRTGRSDWYETITLPKNQLLQLNQVKAKLKGGSKPCSPDRLIAELTFGFWSSFFTAPHKNSGIAYYLCKSCFALAPKPERNYKKLAVKWQNIRKLRNRISHHERILHFSDLDQQHQDILELICWMNPTLYHTVLTLDRFSALRTNGLPPLQAQLQQALSRQNART